MCTEHWHNTIREC